MPKARKKRTTGNKKGQREEVKFDYIKSNFFRVIHADGVWGGVTPSLQIHVGFWNQRQPIPQEMVHEVTVDGGVGPELRDKRLSRDAIVREVEAGIVMNVDVARSFVAWLQEKVQIVEKALKDKGKAL